MVESIIQTMEEKSKMDEQEKFLDVQVVANNPSLYTIVWRGGPGRVPVELQGFWSKRTGLYAIHCYNEKKG